MSYHGPAIPPDRPMPRWLSVTKSSQRGPASGVPAEAGPSTETHPASAPRRTSESLMEIRGEMTTFANQGAEIRAAAARTLEHCPYHSARRIDVRTGATSLTQALILAAGGWVRAGRGWACEPAEPAARESLHAVAREVLAEVGVIVPAGACPSRVLARWERAAGDAAAMYRLVGAHPAASHHLRVTLRYPGQGGAAAPQRGSPASSRTPLTYTERG